MGAQIDYDERGRVICYKYMALIPEITCIKRQCRVPMRSTNGGKIIDWIDDPTCQKCRIGSSLKLKFDEQKGVG